MKAQRRHDLQTNSLAKVISGGPSTYGRLGGRILLVLLVALLIYMLVRYRISTSRESARMARENLTVARSVISNLHFADLLNAPPSDAASLRRRWTAEASTALEEAARLSDEPEVLAEVLLARGDLNWALSTLAEIPGAATQPTLRMEQPTEQLITGAAESYTGVLNQYPQETAAVIGAHFGLAAVAENQGKWDEARRHYQLVIDHPTVAESYKAQARLRLERASEWSKPVLLAAPTTQATTGRSGVPFVNPGTGPATAPATAPAAAPTTAPATSPTAATTRPAA